MPVIGLVQVGAQARADRYTYIPTVGLEIAVIWGVAEILARYPRGKTAVAALAAVAYLVYASVAWTQVAHWQT